MKKVLFFALLFLPLWLMAQELPFTVKSRTKFSSAAILGYEKVDSVRYYQLRFIQEFNLWKFGLGLDLDFLFDKRISLRKDEWNELEDLLDKIYYLNYGKKGDTFFFHLGGFPGLTLGNGLVMQNYSNMLLYPDLRKTGLMLGGSPHWPTQPSFELFASDLQRAPVLAMAARFKPLPDSTLKVLDQINLGFSLATDTNQYGNLRHLVADSLACDVDLLGRKPATVFGLAYTLPMVKNEKMTLGHYVEFSHILNYGSGVILPGIYADFKALRVNLEYRLYGGQYVPAYFDHYYEEDRAVTQEDELDPFVTKAESLASVKASRGWNGSIQAIFSHKVKTRFAWQNMIGRKLKTGKSIWFSVWVDTQYKRLENVSLSYSKINTERMSIRKFYEPNTDIKSYLTFRISKKRWFLIAKYSESFRDRNKDGKINWIKEVRRSVGAGLKYIY